jgi:hypothetical protein
MKKQLLIIIPLSFQIASAFSQKATIVSPNEKMLRRGVAVLPQV